MHIESDAWEQISTLRPEASLHKGFPQRGRAAEQPAPFVGGGRRPPPLLRLAFGLTLEFCSQISFEETPLCEKNLLRSYHFWSQRFCSVVLQYWVAPEDHFGLMFITVCLFPV